MLQVAEHASWFQQCVDLGIEGSLALIGAVMNREAGYHHVEAAKVGQRFVQVVLDHLDFVVATKSLPCGVQHGRRKVESNAVRVGPVDLEQCQKTAIPGSEIENSLDLPGDEVQQDGFTLRAMRNAICPGKILQRVFGSGILVEIRGKSHRRIQVNQFRLTHGESSAVDTPS